MFRHGSGTFRQLVAPIAGPLLCLVGFIVWTVLSVLGGMEAEGFRLREAWDIPAYFYLGLPIMALAVAVAAFLVPKRVWRWPLWLVGGHQVGVVLVGIGMQSGPSLILLSAILAMLLVVLFTIPALVGYFINRLVTERAY